MTAHSPDPLPPAAFKRRNGLAVTRDYLEKLIKKGVGSGEREAYRPWLKISSLPSRGSSRIVPGVRIARGHHCLSNGEYYFLVLMEFNQEVVDIREQFPLIEYDETFSIALQNNIKPTKYVGTNVPFVHTADFMLTIVRPGEEPSLHAISLKYRKEIDEASSKKRARIFEKQEIEKIYWERRGVKSSLYFVEDLPLTRIKNLIVLRTHSNLSSSIASDTNLRKVTDFLEAASSEEAEKISLERLLRLISKHTYIEYRTTKEIFFYLVWHKKIHINIDAYEIRLSKPVLGLFISPAIIDNRRSVLND